jgi:hypothetical protein
MTLEEVLEELCANPFRWYRNDVIHLSTGERLIRLAYEAGERNVEKRHTAELAAEYQRGYEAGKRDGVDEEACRCEDDARIAEERR